MNQTHKRRGSRNQFKPIWYSDFAKPVEDLRSELHRFVQRELQDSETYHDHERSRWSGNYGTCCYYFPFWIAQALGYSLDASEVKNAASGNFFLYHYYTLRDDSLDEASASSEMAAFGGDLFLAEGLASLGKTGIPSDILLYQFSRCLRIAVNAEKKLSKISRTDTNSSFDVNLSGQKAALGKLSAFALALTSDQQEALIDLEVGMDRLAVGLQLIDDIVDWRDDFEGNRFTLPILNALDSIRVSGEPESLTCVGQEIFSNGAGEGVLRIALNYFQEALVSLPAGAEYFRMFIRRLEDGVAKSISVLGDTTAPWNERERRLRVNLQGGGT